MEDLLVRDCYADLYDRYVLPAMEVQEKLHAKQSKVKRPIRNIFFTGTPGVGTSVMRTYMAGRQIQRAKEQKRYCAIVFAKSPRQGSELYVLVINEGIIQEATTWTNIYACTSYLKLLNVQV